MVHLLPLIEIPVARGPGPSTARPTFLVVEMVVRLSACRHHPSRQGWTTAPRTASP